MIIKSKKFNNLMRGNMSENIQLEIKNIGPIHEANIDLGKLNIMWVLKNHKWEIPAVLK